MPSKLRFYQVKPEFDGFSYQIEMPDKRFTRNIRTEKLEFVGYELISEKVYKILISQKGFLVADMFDEIYVAKEDIYWFFGAMFWTRNGKQDVIRQEKIKHAKLVRKMQDIYAAYCMSRRIRTEFLKRMLITHLSNETLQECIEYYYKII